MRSRRSCSCASASGIAGGRNEAEDGLRGTVRGEIDIPCTCPPVAGAGAYSRRRRRGCAVPFLLAPGGRPVVPW